MLYLTITLFLSLLGTTLAQRDPSRLSRFGALSPYHAAPVKEGIKVSLPSDCKVDQIMHLGRHGARYPEHESEGIKAMAAAVARAKDCIASADLPEELQFLRNGYVSDLGVGDLVEAGRQQLFAHGKSFRAKYPTFKVDELQCSSVKRVVESTDYFGRGYFGDAWADNSSAMISIIPADSSTVSHITPWHVCKELSFDTADKVSAEWGSIYLPPITKRLNYLVPGLNFTTDDTLAAFQSCGYDYAAHDSSPWCDVFTDEEIEKFEYDADISMNAIWGSRLPNNGSAVMGSIYINTLIDRFSARGSQPAYVEFGHDVTISLALTAMGLTKDIPQLSTSQIITNRKYRSSQQTPFAAQMVFEKFSCSSSFSGPQIRLILNEAPFSLETCIKSKKDAEYGSCSFDNFVQANSFSRSVKYGDAAWTQACGEVV
ncbi:phosphoglycerate mutase-like protein [Pleurotus eryngii]|uniref:Phosphoglycerate mutase-like protein n=1 Tax=Pleurotus eryngii TaxID=5323 RepID=A0A9P6DF19_PLEER|nr:phosphoglycerate mutase-like protein [Pleurotus eryngii]